MVEWRIKKENKSTTTEGKRDGILETLTRKRERERNGT